MIVCYISLLASSNTITTAKILQLSFLKEEDGTAINTLKTYIKPTPRVAREIIERLGIDYGKVKSARPFCDLVPELLSFLENTQTVFVDVFSEQLFRKAFKEVGYPLGKATYILERIFKKISASKAPFSLKNALEVFQLNAEHATMGNCEAMALIFEKLGAMDKIHASPKANDKINGKVKYNTLPKKPGVYFFRDTEGQVLYVGKAIDIHKRVKSHFTNINSFERNLCSLTTSVDFEETGSELIALLLEAYYIYYLKPPLNSQQLELIEPYILTTKLDAKGILRLQPIQKSYSDSENEFYYNRESVLMKIQQVQRQFRLCRRYTGLERAAAHCSDTVFCQGICRGMEAPDIYNAKVKAAMQNIEQDRPSYIIKTKGRFPYESGFVLVKHGLYQGFGFVDQEAHINTLEDIEGFIKHYPHTYFTSRIIDQYHRTRRRGDLSVLPVLAIVEG